MQNMLKYNKWRYLNTILDSRSMNYELLPPPLTCKINYVNMQHIYVNMRRIYVDMQHNYVDMHVINFCQKSFFSTGNFSYLRHYLTLNMQQATQLCQHATYLCHHAT